MAAGGTSRIQLILQGRQQVAAGLSSTAQQVGHLARQTQRYNLEAERGTHRTFLMNQALFTMRRFAYAGTLALGALGTAAIGMGVKFNITMEQNTIAMAHFLGSNERAVRELGYLYELAARTPFEFQNVVEAERRFLAFGYSLQEARRALVTIGDVAAGLGGDPAMNIERLVLVMGQVRATGRVLGQDMLQLQQLGINTNRIFREELGLTREDLAQGVGELQIPAEVAIPALLRGMRKQFQGMAIEQSKTLGGMLSTLRDYRNQFLGAMTEPITDRLRTQVVPGLIDLTKELSTAAKAGASFTTIIGIIDRKLGAHGGLLTIWLIFRDIAIGVGNIFTNVLMPAFRIAFTLSYPLILGIREMAFMFRFLTEHSYILGLVMGGLATAFIYTATVGLVLSLWTIRQTLLWKLAIWTGMRFNGVIRWMIILIYRSVVAMKAWAFATTMARSSLGTFIGLQFVHNGLLAVTIRNIWGVVLATRGWIASLVILRTTIFSIPVIGWILAIITALVYLEIRFRLVSRAIEHMFNQFKRINDWLRDSRLGRIFSGAISLAAGNAPVIGPAISGIRGAFASGGTAQTSGRYLVGEAGPEVIHLPMGARVIPIQASKIGSDGGFAMPEYIELHTHIDLDGREIAEVVSKYRLSRSARK